MNKALKRVSCILLLIVVVLTASACGKSGGNDIDISGYYELTSVTSGTGTETTDEDIQMMKDLGLVASLECFADGTASLDLFGEKLDVTYDLEKMVFRINGDEAGFEFRDGNIILVDGGDSLTFAPAVKE